VLCTALWSSPFSYAYKSILYSSAPPHLLPHNTTKFDISSSPSLSEYWRFPTSDDLFIRDGGPGSLVDPDREAFNKLHAMRETDKDAIEDSKIDIKTEQLINHKTPIKNENENDPQTLGWKGWKRVSGVDQIRRIVEHLEDSQQEQELRNNLVTSLLADRRVTDIPGRYREGREGTNLDPTLDMTSSPFSLPSLLLLSTSLHFVSSLLSLMSPSPILLPAVPSVTGAASSSEDPGPNQGNGAVDDRTEIPEDGSGSAVPTAADNIPGRDCHIRCIYGFVHVLYYESSSVHVFVPMSVRITLPSYILLILPFSHYLSPSLNSPPFFISSSPYPHSFFSLCPFLVPCSQLLFG
jgi:hypothetical protein